MPKPELQDLEMTRDAGPLTAGATEAGRDQTVATLWLLWNRRHAVIRAAVVGCAIFGAVAFLIPARYQSTTQLMPPDGQSGSGLEMAAALAGRMDGAFAGLAGSVLGLKSSGELFVGILQSRTVQDDLVAKFDLRSAYGERLWENARGRLAENTSISEDRKSGILGITVTDRTPQRAAAMAQEYVAELNTVVSQLTTSSAHRERMFLEGRLTEVKQDLENAENDFSQFASKNTAIDVKEQGRAMIGAAAELEGQLIAAETELEGLRQIYTPNNVRVRSVQARIDEYRRQMRKLGGKPGDDVQGEPSQNGNTSEEGSDGYPSIRQLPILGVEWSDLYRRTKVQEVVLETLTKQYELAKVEEARETPGVKVLDVADVPERKWGPPRKMIVILGTGMVFVFSCGWLLTLARWQEIDSRDPGKILSTQIFQSIRTGVRGMVNRVLRRSFDRGEDSHDRS